jgi:glycosidase
MLIVLTVLVLYSCKKKEETESPEPSPSPPAAFDPPATEDIVMYEVNLRAFSSNGNLQGVINGLDHIKSLGVNVIWLMPIHPIGAINSVNSPYSVQDYTKVNPEFGDLGDLQNLVEKAHEKGMAVILDWVANHTAWDNPWISHTDWYTQDGNGNIIHPPGTNWMDVADLNYDHDEMRLAMIGAMKFWIDTANIDGFRCDAADMVPYDFWKQAIDSLTNFSAKDLVLLAEGGRSDHFDAGFDMNFGWSYYSILKGVFEGSGSPPQILDFYESELSDIPNGKRKPLFTTNHDESAWDATPMVIFNGKEGALAASAITIFFPGVPLMYDGQEVGVINNIPFFSNDPINWTLNPDMLESYRHMLNFYGSSKAARSGSFAGHDDDAVVSYSLEKDQEFIWVLVNTENAQVTFDLPVELSNKNWTDVLNGSSLTIDNSIDLAAYEYHVFQLTESD